MKINKAVMGKSLISHYTVIVAGIPYYIQADYYKAQCDKQVIMFYKDHVTEPVKVAEFNASKIDGIIEEKNNATN